MIKILFIPILVFLSLPTSIKADPIVPIIKNILNNDKKNSTKNKPTKQKKDNFAPSTNIFGKYGSSYEAYSACRSWAYNNRYYYKKNGDFDCRKDIETKQVLGRRDFKVKKRFKY